MHNYPNRTDIPDILDKYCKEKKIYRHNIRLCDLSSISKLIKIKIDYVRSYKKEYKLR